MKLHLSPSLRKALLACMSAVTVSSAYADVSFMAEGVNRAEIEASSRFYDTGKGYYFSWWTTDAWQDLKNLRVQHGHFDFLGDLSERIPEGTTRLDYPSLTDDSNTCWAQVGMNLVEYWHSYYGVFYKGAEELPYGYTYDKQYLDETGGTLSLKQNLLFLDTFNNCLGNLEAYWNWVLDGDAFTVPGSIEVSGKGGYWKDAPFFEGKVNRYEVLDAEKLTAVLPSVMGFSRNGNDYSITTKGQLAYLGLSPNAGEGHALTCYGFEMDDEGLIAAVYVTNSDDREYKLFKLYVKDLYLYEDAECTERWQYASDDTWRIDSVEGFRTPKMMQDMLAQYENAENPLIWTGAREVWETQPAPAISEKLPDEESGWKVKVNREYFPIFGDSSRIVQFDDYASSRDVAVRGAVNASAILLRNSSHYTFTGTTSASISADYMDANGGGSAYLRNVSISGGKTRIVDYTVEMGTGASLRFEQGDILNGGCLKFMGGTASFDSLTISSYGTLEVAENSSLLTATTRAQGDTSILFSTAGATLTFGGDLSADCPISLLYSDDAEKGKKYSLITFSDSVSDWSTIFRSDYGVLSFSNNTLYLTYSPVVQLQWGDESGIWSASQWNGNAVSTNGVCALFNGKLGTDVTVQGRVTPHSISVSDGYYIFYAGAEEAAVEIEEKLTISGGAHLTARVPVLVEEIEMSDFSTLVMASGGERGLHNLKMSKDSTLRVSNETQLAVQSVSSVLGNIQVVKGSALSLTSYQNVLISGKLEAQGDVEFRAADAVTPVLYSFASEDPDRMSGRVTIAENTTLVLHSDITDACINMDGGNVFLDGEFDYTIETAGNGCVTIGSDASVKFASNFNVSNPFSGNLKLKVEGSAVIGSKYHKLTQGTQVAEAEISGYLYLYTGEGNVILDSISLNGGSLVFNDVDDATVKHNCHTINMLKLSSQSNEISSDALDGLPLGQMTDIGTIEGFGDLVLKGETPVAYVMYRIGGTGEGGYSGSIRVRHDSGNRYESSGTFKQGTVLELGDVSIGGIIDVDTKNLCTSPEFRNLYFSALGINGNVTVGGLLSTSDLSIPLNTYLYSGEFDTSSAAITVDEVFTDRVQESEHTLTIDTGHRYVFDGTVCKSLNLIKKGTGTQEFTGDMSMFDGSVEVQGGALKFAKGIGAASTIVRNSALISGESITTGSSLVMSNASLAAKSLISTSGEFTGVNTIDAESVRGESWVFNLEKNNRKTPLLTLLGDGSISISSLSLTYNKENMYATSYKLLQYHESAMLSRDISGLLANSYLITETIDGEKYYTLMYDVADGALLPPREQKATLTWKGGSGIWASDTGASEGAWVNSNVQDLNFYEGDSVVFDKAADVTLKGTLSPASVVVSSADSVVFSGDGAISGSGGLLKSGNGKLTINTANEYTGGTEITGGTVQIGHVKALGTGEVQLKNATLDIQSNRLKNNIICSGSTTIDNGGDYVGALTMVDGSLGGNVNISKNANIHGGVVKAVLTGTGSVLVDGIATFSGDNSYEGGTLLSGATLTVSHANGLGVGDISTSGNCSLTVANGCVLQLNDSINNSGNLTLVGSIDASRLAKSDADNSYVDINGQIGQGGFRTSGRFVVSLVKGGVTQALNARVSYNNMELHVADNGEASYSDTVDYSKYLVSDMAAVSISSINNVARSNGCNVTDITLSGGTLTLDSSANGNLALESGSLILANGAISVGKALTLSGPVSLQLGEAFFRDGAHTLFSVNQFTGQLNDFLIDIPEAFLVSTSLQYDSKNHQILLKVESQRKNLVWNGDKKSTWNLSGATCWKDEEGHATSFANGDKVTLGDISITLEEKLAPGSITVNNSKRTTFKVNKKSPGSLIGDGSLSKLGKGTLTLNDGNSSWTGDTYLKAGTIKVQGATSLGKGDVYLQGGTLNLGSKAVANDIVQEKSAAIMSGKKFTGTYTLEGGELQKGSTLNISKTATLAGGTVNGTLSGNGTTTVTGSVTLGDKGKITTNALSVTDGGNLTTSAKGLSMNSKVSAVSVKEGSLTLGGKLSAFSLKLDDGTLRTSSAKPAALTLKGDVELRNDSDMQINGKFTANRLALDASSLKLSGSKPQNLTVKQGLSIRNDSELSLNGKLSAAELTLSDSSLKLSNSTKPQSVTVKGNATLSYATADINGKFTANNLNLTNSELKLGGAKPQNLTVKQNLTIGSDSRITLNGKLSAGSLSIQKDGKLTMSGSKPVTLKVKGALTLASGSSIILDYDFVQGKTYNLLTFGHYTGSQDFYSIFGVDEDDCTIQKTDKAITMTLTGNWNPQGPRAVSAAETELLPAAAPAVVKANPAADALVQANWGQLEASRAFVNAMANRSMAVQLGNGERAVWASAIGSSSRHSSAGGHNGADTNVSGGAFGLETQVGRASLFGMALGNSRTRVSAHGFGTIEQDTTHLGLYGRSNWRSGIATDWSAAYGLSESETMGSDWSQKHLQLDGRVSYNHELNASTVLSPFAGMQYYASDAATVDGTSTGSLQNLRAEIGVGASHRTGRLGVYGEIALHQDIARNTPKVEMEGVRYSGMNPGRTGLNFTVGASYELSKQWSVNSSYTGEVVENANAHSANIGVTYKF